MAVVIVCVTANAGTAINATKIMTSEREIAFMYEPSPRPRGP
jgi:hypothetical protein